MVTVLFVCSVLLYIKQNFLHIDILEMILNRLRNAALDNIIGTDIVFNMVA